MTVLHEANSIGKDCHVRFILTDNIFLKFIAGEGELISGSDPPNTTFMNKPLEFNNYKEIAELLQQICDSTTDDLESLNAVFCRISKGEITSANSNNPKAQKLILAHYRIKEAAKGMLDYLRSSGRLN